MVRFGVLGLGFMGRTHLASLARHAEAKVVAVCDTEPERLAGSLAPGGGNVPVRGAAWEESGLRRVGKPEEVFAAADVDAVVLAVPTYLHADLAVAALLAGKHVFCEKPMALNLSDCDRMIAAARKGERVLMVGHCLRFWGEYLAAAEIVRSRELGHLQSIILTRRGAVPQFGARN